MEEATWLPTCRLVAAMLKEYGRRLFVESRRGNFCEARRWAGSVNRAANNRAIKKLIGPPWCVSKQW